MFFGSTNNITNNIFIMYQMNTYLLGSISPNPLVWLTFLHVPSIIRSIIREQNYSDPYEDKHTSKFPKVDKQYLNTRPFQTHHTKETMPAKEKTMPMPTIAEIRLLSMKDVCRKLGCHKSKIHRLRREGKFPHHVMHIGQVRWYEHDIDAYIHALPRGV